jgi:hypothetical protein
MREAPGTSFKSSSRPCAPSESNMVDEASPMSSCDGYLSPHRCVFSKSGSFQDIPSSSADRPDVSLSYAPDSASQNTSATTTAPTDSDSLRRTPLPNPCSPDSTAGRPPGVWAIAARSTGATSEKRLRPSSQPQHSHGRRHEKSPESPQIIPFIPPYFPFQYWAYSTQYPLISSYFFLSLFPEHSRFLFVFPSGIAPCYPCGHPSRYHSGRWARSYIPIPLPLHLQNTT